MVSACAPNGSERSGWENRSLRGGKASEAASFPFEGSGLPFDRARRGAAMERPPIELNVSGPRVQKSTLDWSILTP